MLEPIGDACEQEPSVLCQCDARIVAPEQLASELLLKLSHLMADCALRDA
jgi:hypothetical protein